MNTQQLHRRIEKLDNAYLGFDRIADNALCALVSEVFREPLLSKEFQKRIAVMVDLLNGLSRTAIEIPLPPFCTYGDFWTRHAAACVAKKVAVAQRSA